MADEVHPENARMRPLQHDQKLIPFHISERGIMRLIYPDALLEMSMVRLRQVFDYMCCYAWQHEHNREAIRATEEEFKAQFIRLKAEWDMTSITFQREYRMPANRHVEADNKKLLQNVAKAKRAFTRLEKLYADFQGSIKKYHCSNCL